jgi:hypothetical protein
VTARVGINGDPNEDRSPTCLTVETVGSTEWLRAALFEALGELAGGLDPAVVTAAARWVHTGVLKRFDRPVPRTRSVTWLRLFAGGSVDDYLDAVCSVRSGQLAEAAVALTDHGGREIRL